MSRSRRTRKEIVFKVTVDKASPAGPAPQPLLPGRRHCRTASRSCTTSAAPSCASTCRCRRRPPPRQARRRRSRQASPTPAKPPEKRLTRLEKLRLEQEEREKAAKDGNSAEEVSRSRQPLRLDAATDVAITGLPDLWRRLPCDCMLAMSSAGLAAACRLAVRRDAAPGRALEVFPPGRSTCTPAAAGSRSSCRPPTPTASPATSPPRRRSRLANPALAQARQERPHARWPTARPS